MIEAIEGPIERVIEMLETSARAFGISREEADELIALYRQRANEAQPTKESDAHTQP